MFDFNTIEKLCGNLENYLIYQEEELQRIKNILQTPAGKNEDGFYKYKLEQTEKEIKRVKEEITRRSVE